MSTRTVLPALLLFTAVFIAAFNLRAGISSLGAVLADTLDAFQVGGSLAGVITAIPGLFFAIFGLLAVPLAIRLGLTRTLFLGAALAFIGLAARPWVGDIWVFIVLTALVTTGIAVANVLLPAWIKNHGGRHIVALMTVYGSVLGFSGAVGPLTAVLSDAPDAWRWALFLWTIPAALQVLVWFGLVLRVGRDVPSSTPPRTAGHSGGPVRSVSLWRSPTAVFLMLFFGLQSMHAYIQMGWLPKIYVDHGVSAATASLALALTGSFNIIGGLIMPAIISGSAATALRMRRIASRRLAGSSVGSAMRAIATAIAFSDMPKTGMPQPSMPRGVADRSSPPSSSQILRRRCCTGWSARI